MMFTVDLYGNRGLDSRRNYGVKARRFYSIESRHVETMQCFDHVT